MVVSTKIQSAVAEQLSSLIHNLKAMKNSTSSFTEEGRKMWGEFLERTPSQISQLMRELNILFNS